MSCWSAVPLGLALCVHNVVLANVALAQQPASFDAIIGLAVQRTSGVYDEGAGIMGELTVARRFHATTRAGFVAGASASHNLMVGWSDSCDVVPGGTCAPRVPDVRLYQALAGWETASGSVRATTGAGYADPTSGGGAFAVQARVDGALNVVRHAAVVGSVRLTAIPSYRSDRFVLVAFGIGARIR